MVRCLCETDGSRRSRVGPGATTFGRAAAARRQGGATPARPSTPRCGGEGGHRLDDDPRRRRARRPGGVDGTRRGPEPTGVGADLHRSGRDGQGDHSAPPARGARAVARTDPLGRRGGCVRAAAAPRPTHAPAPPLRPGGAHRRVAAARTDGTDDPLAQARRRRRRSVPRRRAVRPGWAGMVRAATAARWDCAYYLRGNADADGGRGRERMRMHEGAQGVGPERGAGRRAERDGRPRA